MSFESFLGRGGLSNIASFSFGLTQTSSSVLAPFLDMGSCTPRFVVLKAVRGIFSNFTKVPYVRIGFQPQVLQGNTQVSKEVLRAFQHIANGWMLFFPYKRQWDDRPEPRRAVRGGGSSPVTRSASPGPGTPSISWVYPLGVNQPMR